MGINFTVDQRTENRIVWTMQCTTAVSLPVCFVTIYLLWTKTPKAAGGYKYLLLTMQAFSALIELHMGVLFSPIPLFPLIGTYCTGILCQAHVPPHISAAVMFFLVLGCVIMLNLSIFYRHQEIIPDNHPLKMGKRCRNVLFATYFIAVETMSVLVFLSDHDSSGSSDYLEKNHPAMVWLTTKDSWIVYDPQGSARFVVYHVLFSHTIQAPLIFGTIRHIFIALDARVSEMSWRTLSFHRAMVNSLLMQSFCWLLVFIPSSVIVLSVLTDSITQDIAAKSFLLAQVFPLINSITVILSSPTYRRSVLNYVKFQSTSVSPKLTMSTTVAVKMKFRKPHRGIPF